MLFVLQKNLLKVNKHFTAILQIKNRTPEDAADKFRFT